MQALTDGLPGLAIQAEGHSSEELARKLAERTLDMVLLYDPPSDTDVQADKVGELKLVLASNVAACPVNQAIREGYIYVDWGTSFASFHARRFGERATARLNVNLASIAISYLESKPGAAYLPLSTVESINSLHRLPEAPSFKRPIFACYRESNDRQAVIQEVVRLIHGVVI